MKVSKSEISKLYPRYQENPSYYDQRIEEVKAGFEKEYGSNEDVRIFSAPGRIEIGGNHTDHQHGCVVAAAIDLDVIGVASATNSSIVRLFSKGYGLIVVDISNLEVVESEKNTTVSLIKGVASRLQQLGYTVGGVDIYCMSSVLSGSGLSSSAAFEVFLGTVFNHLYCNDEVSDVENAKIGQYAENVYFGKPCGLMDQMASSVGNVVAIDFNDPETPIIDNVELSMEEMEHAICIIDSGADHADLTNEYADITVEMKKVAQVFNKEYLREITKEQLINSASEVIEKAGDRGYLRALHFQNENARAILQKEALQQKDYSRFLQLVTESGFSSFMYLQNIFATKDATNQKVSIALAMCQELLQGKGAFRVHGGGFAGTVQAFVPVSMLAEFKNQIEAVLGKDKCYILSIRQVGGVELS